MEANYYWFTLRREGVAIETVNQGPLNFDDLAGWLTASIQQHAKQQYVKDLARNTTRGLKTYRLAGNWFGPAPFGYRVANGRLEFAEPESVAIVRRIFKERASGYGSHTIAKRLTDEGIPTAWNGTRWSAAFIRHVLQRDAYIGSTVIGKNPTARYSKTVEKPITVENTHPPIIDRATWDAVQAMRRTVRRPHGRNGSEGSPLSGLVKCGCCGGTMYSTSRGYVCSTYRTEGKGKCGYCRVHQKPLLKAVAAKIRQHVLMGSPAKLEAEIQRVLDRQRKPQPDTTTIKKRIAKMDAQIERAAGRLLTVDDSLVPDLEKRLLALKRQRDELSESISTTTAANPLPTAKAIASRMWELRVLSEASATKARHVLGQYIDHVRVDFQPVKTKRGESYRITGGTIALCTQEGNSPS